MLPNKDIWKSAKFYLKTIFMEDTLEMLEITMDGLPFTLLLKQEIQRCVKSYWNITELTKILQIKQVSPNLVNISLLDKS